MLSPNIDYFKSKPDDLPKTTILLDNGYHPDKLTQALEVTYPEIMTKIQFELSAKPSKVEKADAIALRSPSGDTSRFVSPTERMQCGRVSRPCNCTKQRLRQRLQRALHQAA